MKKNKSRGVSSVNRLNEKASKHTRILPAIVTKDQNLENQAGDNQKSTQKSNINRLIQRPKKNPTNRNSMQQELEQELEKLKKKLAIL